MMHSIIKRWLPMTGNLKSYLTLSGNKNIRTNEVLDLISGFGIESQITYDDYLQGFENLKALK